MNTPRLLDVDVRLVFVSILAPAAFADEPDRLPTLSAGGAKNLYLVRPTESILISSLGPLPKLRLQRGKHFEFAQKVLSACVPSDPFNKK